MAAGGQAMVEQVVAWIGALTGLASAVKAWREALKSGTSPDEAKAKAAKAGADAGMPRAEATAAQVPALQLIDPPLLQALLDDIRTAQQRFIAALRDPRYTPAQVDQEEAIARESVCRHLKRIKDFNGGQFGAEELERIWQSNRCSAEP
jgi:hypothetical protein